MRSPTFDVDDGDDTIVTTTTVYTTTINVLPDDGPVRSETCKNLFLKIPLQIKLHLCAFVWLKL
jgi:hypothetical protein